MLFNVTYCNQKTGAREVLQIEVASKADIWPILKERGITAVSVQEATGKVSRIKTTTPKGSLSKMRGVFAGLVVVVAAGVAFLLLKPEEKKPVVKTEKPKAQVVKEVKPEHPKPAPKVEKEERPKVDPEKAARIAKLKAMTPEERMEFLFEEAAKKPIDLTPSTNRVFKTGTEQVMSWIFTTELGAMPPPLPRISIRDEAHMAEILMAKNPAFETDSEKAKEAKAMVELAKKELIQFIKQGGSVDEFFEYYRGELVQAHNEWQASQKSVMKVIREEPELAAEYIKEVNSRLREKGIRPVRIPPKFKKELGLED